MYLSIHFMEVSNLLCLSICYSFKVAIIMLELIKSDIVRGSAKDS